MSFSCLKKEEEILSCMTRRNADFHFEQQISETLKIG